MVERNWVFGEPPLPTVVELAGALRELNDTVQSLERSSPELEALVETVRAAQAQLATQAPPDPRPRVGSDPSPDRRVYVDHGYAVGVYNPCFPRYTLELDGDGGAFGTVEFPVSYEGPPGIVHGGFLAVFFDCVLQELNCALGLAGKTAELSLRYRRPTPLLTPLTYRAERVVADRITAHAELFLGDDLLCEAHLVAAKGELAALPTTSPRRA
jgi:hypothetical protein